MSSEIKGITFMYGLADKLNSNSIRILLIPCVSIHESSNQVLPFLCKNGYYDHLGQNHSIIDSCGLIASFVSDIKSKCEDLVYKKITRGGFIGKDKILDLIKNENCDQVMFHLGYKDGIIHPIFEPQDSKHNSISNIYMNTVKPVPPYPAEICVASSAVLHNSNEEELELYRKFRDEYLLNVEDGGIYYELYYFSSPFINSFISNEKDRESILNSIYENKISPFRLLLKKNKYQDAFLLLKTVLGEWLEMYQTDFTKELDLIKK